ncbi:MAG: major capsid protein [Microviridae sp.]|nr:MAG: major capsid protein [Microviridae sp.]
MNRNVESHFSTLPSADIRRSIMDRSSGHKTSFNVGDLVPLYVDEVLPGDSVKITTSKVVRLQTLLTPIMDNMYLDTYWFFVPNRLVWDHWKEFCGENTASAWAPTTEYQIPTIKSPAGGWNSGTIADYFGLPVGVPMTTGDHLPSALPFRGYALICNEFFRDENLSDPLNIPTGDANQQGSNGDNYITDVINGGKPFKAAKYHDLFTSSLPSPQKGTAPQISVGGAVLPEMNIPVFSQSQNIDLDKFYPNSAGKNVPASALRFNYVQGGSATPASGGKDSQLYGVADNTDLRYYAGNESNRNFFNFYPSNLWAHVDEQDLSAGSGVININELRLAFAAQRFLERNARGGSRYAELLLSHFSVRSPDARLQRPEYLGGNRAPLQVHSVNNTAQSEKDFLGDLGANSVTSDVHFDVNKSFTEHGYLFCLGVVRYDHTYAQGLEKMWFRKTIYDFFWPVFANIGEQPIFTDQLYYDEKKSSDVFGYQEAWAEYRYKPNIVTGEMRPQVQNSLASWHLADNYSSAPTLSDSWIREDKTNVDRVLAVSSSVSNQIFGDFYFNAIWTRPMPVYSIPGLIDHN